MKNCDYLQSDPQTPPVLATTIPPAQHGEKHRDKHRAQEEEEEQKRRSKAPRRKWQVFPGKNRFYCDGRVITAGQSVKQPLTLSLILVTSGLFFVFDCPFLVKHLTSCIPVIGGVLLVFVLITLLQTTFSDPGILPRAMPDEATEIQKQIDETGNSSHRPPPRIKEVLINQQVIKLKYCFTCKMFRPPRTSHCRECDNCVERYDHHCPWVGNCIGKRNYRVFYTFIVSLSFHTAFIFGCVTTHLALRADDGKGLVFVLQESPGSALELLICFFSVWPILGLTGFHTYLVASNLTTYEDSKILLSRKSEGEPVTNPFSHGNIFMNCCNVLCGPLPPSLIDRRGFLPEDASVQTATDIELPTLTTQNERNVCTHGTKGLLESVARSPLPSSSCPQGKPQSGHTCPDKRSALNSDPSPELSNVCTGRAHSTPPRCIKTYSKRKKHVVLHIPNPGFDGPASPTSAGTGSTERGVTVLR